MSRRNTHTHTHMLLNMPQCAIAHACACVCACDVTQDWLPQFTLGNVNLGQQRACATQCYRPCTTTVVCVRVLANILITGLLFLLVPTAFNLIVFLSYQIISCVRMITTRQHVSVYTYIQHVCVYSWVHISTHTLQHVKEMLTVIGLCYSRSEQAEDVTCSKTERLPCVRMCVLILYVYYRSRCFVFTVRTVSHSFATDDSLRHGISRPAWFNFSVLHYGQF